MSLRTVEVEIGGNPAICVEGIVDLSSVGDLSDALDRAIRNNVGSVVTVDLDAVPAIDDSALGVLLGAAATARERSGDVELVCNSESLRDRLSRTRLDRAIVVRSTIS